MRTYPKSQGTTLIEALVTTVVFTFVSFTVFAIFNMGQTNWRLMVLRHGMQADGRKAFSMLEADLRRTHFSSVSIDNRPLLTRFVTVGSNTYERSAICMAGLDDWRFSGNYYSDSSRPKWNRYILYYATKEIARQGGTGEELGASGRFLRIILNPCSPGTPPCAKIGQFAYTDLTSVVLTGLDTGTDAWLVANSSGANPLVISYTSLADVNHFSLNQDNTNKVIQITFQTRKKATLSERGDRGSAIGGAYETLQLNLNLAPQNSYYLY